MVKRREICDPESLVFLIQVSTQVKLVLRLVKGSNPNGACLVRCSVGSFAVGALESGVRACGAIGAWWV